MQADQVQTNFICSPSHDPWFNLALEEFLLNRVSARQIILYLWQNDNTVVIGRNQNAWKECDWNLLEREGGKLARRLSGGGAVYHDLGNLNFTFLMDKKFYDLGTQLQVILKALASLGIKAEASGRNDLAVRGRKFSGNAFYFQGEAAYHHGTLLVNSDFTKLSRYLKVSAAKISSKGIDSVRARVINLAEVKAGLLIQDLAQSLIKSFHAVYGGSLSELKLEPNLGQLDPLYQKYASWRWRFGESPNFDISLQNRFSWGEAELGVNIKDGMIMSTTFYSDAMDACLIRNIARQLKNIPLQGQAVSAVLCKIPGNAESQEILNDLSEWLKLKI